MSYYGAIPLRPNQLFIHPQAQESVGANLHGISQVSASSQAYPLANLALYVPFAVASPVNVQSTIWMNGVTAGGNIDIGIYDESGTRIVSLGSTARGTASSVITTTTLTDTVLGPGRYYMAMAHDGTSNIFAWIPAAGLCEAFGVLEQQTAFPLPSTATFAVTTRAYIPFVGLLCQTIAP